MFKKMDIFKDGQYLTSVKTELTCQQVILNVSNRENLYIGGIGNISTINNKMTAKYNGDKYE